MVNLLVGYWQHVFSALFFRHTFVGLKENDWQFFSLAFIAIVFSYFVSGSLFYSFVFLVVIVLFGLASIKLAMIYCLLSVGIDLMRLVLQIGFNGEIDNNLFIIWEGIGVFIYSVRFVFLRK